MSSRATESVELQSDTDCQVSHVGELSPDLQAFVEADDTQGLEGIVRFHKLRQERTDEYRSLWEATDDEDKRKILATVAQSRKRGVMYDALKERLRCSDRTLYRKLNDLEDNNLLTRIGKPAIIKFPEDETRVLAGDVLQTVYN